MFQQLNNVTVGFDFSVGASNALRVAVSIARSSGAKLHVVTAIPGIAEDGAPSVESAGRDVAAGADVLRSVEEKVRENIHEELGTDLDVHIEAGFAKPVQLILESIKNYDADLLIIGALGRDSDASRGLGVDGMRIVRRSPVPVLIIPEDVAWPPRRVLCAVDFSEASERALDAAVMLANAISAPLTALHVIETEPVFDWATFGMTAPPDTAALAAKAQRKLKTLLADRDAGANVAAVCVEGSASRIISTMVHSEEVDLLVIGSIGRSAFQEVLVGGTTERVLRKMPCAILATKPDTFAIQSSERGLPPISGR